MVYRRVGYYDPENSQIAFVREGDRGGPLDQSYNTYFFDAAPRHSFNDTKRRKVNYVAVASSRYREYFPTDEEREEAGLEPLDFTRRSEPMVVDVPASERPLAPSVVYVLPTFGAKPLLGQLDQAFQYIQEFTGFFTPGIVVIFLLGFFWKKATATSALVK